MITYKNDTTICDAALAYAENGWKVFPCRGKVPATAHGVLDATADPVVIARWFRGSSLNLAIATGMPAIDVLDVDVHPSGTGFGALRLVTSAGLARGAQAIVRTPSGGAHLWFAGTAQRNGRLPERHIDFRSLGGYVLAPPTPGYAFEDIRDSDGALDWQAVRELLSPPRRQALRGAVDCSQLAQWLSRRAAGDRNTALFWACCRAAEQGLDTEPLVAAAMTAGLTEKEARATAASAVKRTGPGERAGSRY